ncbi:RxLR effector protein, partial [Phytophthora megakarya]
MRFYQFVVLMAAVLFTISNCASASENSKLVVADGSVRVLTSYTPIKRRLRAESTNDGEEEQRMFSFKFTPSKTKEFEALIEGKPIKEAFNKLDLGKMTIAKKGKVEANMVKDVVKSDQFKVWFRHASKLNKQNPETAMLEQLTHSFGEKEVAIMISMSKNMLSDTGRMFG